MKDLKEIMKMKKSEPMMGEDEKQAKKEMLLDLIKEMNGMMAGSLHGLKNMKKVTVASNDKKGLEEGLDKAKNMLSKKDDESMEDPIEESHESSDEEDLEDKGESPSDDSMLEDHVKESNNDDSKSDGSYHDSDIDNSHVSDQDHNEMSDDEIDQKIQELQSKKKRK